MMPLLHDSHPGRGSPEMVRAVETLLPAFAAFISDRLGISVPSYRMEDIKKTILQACFQFGLSPADYLGGNPKTR